MAIRAGHEEDAPQDLHRGRPGAPTCGHGGEQELIEGVDRGTVGPGELLDKSQRRGDGRRTGDARGEIEERPGARRARWIVEGWPSEDRGIKRTGYGRFIERDGKGGVSPTVAEAERQGIGEHRPCA